MNSPDSHHILDHQRLGVLVTSSTGSVIHINKKAKDLLGLGNVSEDQNNVIGQLSALRNLILDSLAGKQSYSGVLPKQKQSSIGVQIEVLEQNGKVEGAICNLVDLDHFHQVKSAPTATENVQDKSFETIFEASFDGLWLCDKKGKVLKINRATENNLAVQRSDVVGKKTKDLVHLGLYDKTLINEVIKTRKKVSQQQTALLTNKQILSTGIPILDENGEVSLVVVNERDLSDLIATQQQLEELSEKLVMERKLRERQAQSEQTEKMASLGRMAAGIVHEINNPLTSILLNSSIIKEKIPQDQSLGQLLDYVIEDTERCQDIVKNLLAYSRQSSPNKEVFHINRVMTDSLSLIHNPGLFAHIQVVQVTEDKEIYVKADKNQLCQVMINLITNAIDAMDMKGTLTLQTRWLEDKGMACFEVTDTGSGIQKEDVAKIFDPFFTTKPFDRGTGLGLSMAYGIMQKNNGRIFVQDTGPHGTTIALELPAVNAAEEAINNLIG